MANLLLVLHTGQTLENKTGSHMNHNSFKGQDGLYQQCRNVQPYREDLQSEGFVYGAFACWAGISLA